MLLIDAGPLVAILDAGDQYHRACTEVLRRNRQPLLTTWPAVTEAMYLLSGRGGWPGQAALWEFVQRGSLEVVAPQGATVKRSRDLMERYRSVPMDLADATLVALAEERKLTRIFTLDADFRVYRLHGRRVFEIVP